MAPELTSRLGGIGAIKASGAFFQVSELSYGSAWLQATAAPEGYDDERAREVFGVPGSLSPAFITAMVRAIEQAPHPPSTALDATAVLWRFFAAHPG